MTLSRKIIDKITKLRKSGYSLLEIAKKLDIAKSSASLYCRSIKLNQQAKERIEMIRKEHGFRPGNTANLRAIKWNDDKVEEVRTLYISGLSMKDVGKKLHVTLSAISHIMSRRGIARRHQSATRLLQFYKSSLSFNPKLNLNPKEQNLKIAGLMLYWGEGAKTIKHNKVDFANSNPLMIATFCKMLREIYRVDESRLRGNIYHFDSQDSNKLLKYWAHTTMIPSSQFFRPFIRPHNPNRKHDKIAYGVCHVVYSDKRLLELLLEDIHKLTIEMLGYQSGQMVATVNRAA